MTRFVLLFFCCAVLAGGCLTSAAASEYRDDVQSGRIVFATGFETAAEQEMKLPQCYSIGRFGRNGSHCLKVERRNPKAYTLKGFRVSVVPGKNYLLEFYARSGNLRRNSSSSGAPGIAGFEYYGSDGKWIAGKYLHLGVPGEEWRKYSLTLSIPENPKIAKVSLLFYLCKGWTGTLWIDDIMLRNLGTIHSAVIVEPGNLCFRNGDGRFILKCNQDSPDALAARLTLSNGGKDYEQVLEVGPDKILRGDFGKLSPGKAGLKIELLDRKRKKIIARESFRMRVTDGKVPENAALIDRYGRLIVNGKPFMPVGAFATLDGNLEKQVGRLQEAGLNSVIGYCNFAMKAAPAKKTQQENILAALDLLERSGIKSIFCVKECIPDFGTGESFDGVRGWLEPVREIARAIRKHPALLAWYIGDEVPVSNIGNLIRLRETLAEEERTTPDGKFRMRYSTNHDRASDASTCPEALYKTEDGAMAAFVTAAFMGGVPMIYGSQEIGHLQRINFFVYDVMDWDSNPQVMQEYVDVMNVYVESAELRGGEMKHYDTGDVLSFHYPAADGRGLFVMVNTTGESLTVRTPMERAGGSVRNLMTGESSSLAATVSLDAYQYLIYETH